MVAKRKTDETGDSDDLQSLFDDIAAGTGTDTVAPVPASAAPASAAPVAPAPATAAPVAHQLADDGDDSDDLQALFDAEAGRYAPSEDEDEQEATVFKRIGKMTRKLHDMLFELGLDSKLQEAANSMPDARQRLTYVTQMTEQAVGRVLNASDVAKPAASNIQAGATALGGRWDRVYNNQLSVEEFKVLAGETRAFLGSAAEAGQLINAQLQEIIMAQEFQDLTGQVIKKVLDMAQALESQLLGLLIEAAPEDVRTEKAGTLLNGPVISSEGRDDVVTSQEQVDDLLASLGF